MVRRVVGMYPNVWTKPFKGKSHHDIHCFSPASMIVQPLHSQQHFANMKQLLRHFYPLSHHVLVGDYIIYRYVENVQYVTICVNDCYLPALADLYHQCCLIKSLSFNHCLHFSFDKITVKHSRESPGQRRFVGPS